MSRDRFSEKEIAMYKNRPSLKTEGRNFEYFADDVEVRTLATPSFNAESKVREFMVKEMSPEIIKKEMASNNGVIVYDRGAVFCMTSSGWELRREEHG